MKHLSPIVLAVVFAGSGLWLLSSTAHVQTSQDPEVQFQRAIQLETIEGNLNAAIDLYKQVINNNGHNRVLATKALLRLGGCYEKQGNAEARKTYEHLVTDYADQSEQARAAQARLMALQENRVSSKDVIFSNSQVWAGPEVDYEGSPSPDGRYLSFVDYDTGDLAVRDLGTGKNRRITNKGSWEESDEFALFSRWSPDGKWIAYDWYDGGCCVDLYVVASEGGKPHILVNYKKDEWMQTYDWSPDGKQILTFMDGTDDAGHFVRQIVLVSAENGATTVLKSYSGRGDWPQLMRFSRDGRYIAYDWPQQEDSAYHDIFLLPVDGDREIRLVRHPADDRLLGWLPDREGILFASERTGSQDIWFLPVLNGMPHGRPGLIKGGIEQIIPMGFSRSGTFYYAQGQQMYDVYDVAIDPRSGKVLTQPEIKIKGREGKNSWPDYSFDGKYLAYVSTRNQSFQAALRPNILCIQSLENGETREFQTKFKRLAGTRWAPDGRSLYLGAADNLGEGIYQVDVQNGKFTLILRAKFRFLGHKISPDGNTLVYQKRDDSRAPIWQIISRNLRTGDEKQLHSGGAQTFSISADGRLAMMQGGRTKVLRVMPLSGGESKELFRFEESKPSSSEVEWSADGEYIYFTRDQSNEDKAQVALWRIAADGGEPQEVNLRMYNFQVLAAHPNGRSLAFSSLGFNMKKPAIWVMENFLPK
jgi:Tol biopolymer transport system component